MALIPLQWSDSKGKKVYKFPQPFFERPDADSRITWNPETQVGELYYNIKTAAPLNPKAMEKQLGPVFKRLFNSKKYICIVELSNKIRNEDYYRTQLQFYFKTPVLPEHPEQVPELIEKHIVFQVYAGTDTKTGETKYYEYQELPANQKFLIIQQCVDPKNTSKGKPVSILGKYWEFAE